MTITFAFLCAVSSALCGPSCASANMVILCRKVVQVSIGVIVVLNAKNGTKERSQKDLLSNQDGGVC